MREVGPMALSENPMTKTRLCHTPCGMRCEVDAFPSLDAQRVLASEMFGDRGPGLFTEWLSVQFNRVDGAEFAREFTEHVALAGVAAGDFNHRDVRSSRGCLLGGIRFYGRDVSDDSSSTCAATPSTTTRTCVIA